MNQYLHGCHGLFQYFHLRPARLELPLQVFVGLSRSGSGSGSGSSSSSGSAGTSGGVEAAPAAVLSMVLVLATMTMNCRMLELLLQTQNLQACLCGPVSRLASRLTCLRELPITIGNLPPAPPPSKGELR